MMKFKSTKIVNSLILAAGVAGGLVAVGFMVLIRIGLSHFQDSEQDIIFYSILSGFGIFGILYSSKMQRFYKNKYDLPRHATSQRGFQKSVSILIIFNVIFLLLYEAMSRTGLLNMLTRQDEGTLTSRIVYQIIISIFVVRYLMKTNKESRT